VIAVDTNVLVRLLTNDNAAQAARSAAVFRAAPVFVPETVLLESEWVLRYSYGLAPRAIARAFLALLGLPTVTFEDAPAAYLAIRMLERGIDFACAASRQHCGLRALRHVRRETGEACAQGFAGPRGSRLSER